MNRFSAAVFAFLIPLTALGQNFDPPPTVKPTEEQLREIKTRMVKLEAAIAGLRKKGVPDDQLADVEIYHKAAEWIVRHGEFYQKECIEWTIQEFDRGLERAGQLEKGSSAWRRVTGRPIIRGYRSGIDGSIQPYAVTLPADYGKDPKKVWRLDVVLHGRNTKLTEVSFLHQFGGDKATPKGRDFIQIDIYGRGNNAYRWAGESDVDEALIDFRTGEERIDKLAPIDWSRLVLRGFSMGGAGTWHLGLHHPDRWSVIGPGAGFTSTHGYIKNLPEKLPAYQEACLHIYDAVDYAENAFHVPVVAYSGDKDPQMQAAVNIDKRLENTPFKITHLIAPGLEHKFPPEWQAKAEAEYRKHVDRGRIEHPNRVHFVTYTLKYSTCEWVSIEGLDEHYRQARVDAERDGHIFRMKTENVRLLRLFGQKRPKDNNLVVEIDGQKLRAAIVDELATQVLLERRDGKWTVPELRRIREINGMKHKNEWLPGPIDDAFTKGFVCVRGTGKPWHETTQKYADADLRRFEAEWNKFMRGKLPVKKDVDVTADEMENKHLVLFGDPASNSLIARVIDKLPMEWTREKISFAGKSVTTGDHIPVMIYSSPLGHERYVVLNSGHTFHAADFQGTNALLYPRLGDYALLKLTGDEKDPLKMEVVTAGLFDEFWRLPK